MRTTALVTGGSRGIGAACAVALAADGYEVVIGYNENREAAKSIAGITKGRCFQADVSDSGAVNRMFDYAGRVDLLVCCAGISHYGLFTDLSDEQWRLIFEVNVGGVINCCRAAIPGMVRNKSGRIITISSVWGITGASCEAVYAASKAAVIGLTKSLAKELAPSGVTVNCVAPGVIETDMLGNLTEEDKAELRRETPAGRLGAPEDVAAAVRFLASDSASFITGQVISPNGGLLV